MVFRGRCVSIAIASANTAIDDRKINAIVLECLLLDQIHILKMKRQMVVMIEGDRYFFALFFVKKETPCL